MSLRVSGEVQTFVPLFVTVRDVLVGSGCEAQVLAIRVWHTCSGLIGWTVGVGGLSTGGPETLRGFAAFGCFCVGGWYVWVMGTGTLS